MPKELLSLSKVFRYFRWKILRRYRVEFPNEEKSILDWIWYHVRKVFGSGDFTRFVVIAERRTGSNMLMSFLDAHPQVYVRGEFLSFTRGRMVSKLLDPLYRRQPAGVLAAGFKTFYDLPYDGDSSILRAELSNIVDLRVVMLTRRNKLAQFASLERASKSKAWVADIQSDKAAKETVLISPNAFENFIELTEQQQAELRKVLGHHQSLEITYEELTKDPAGAFKKVTDFLGVVFSAPRTRLKKQRESSLSEFIDNYAELERYYRGKPQARFFE